MIHNTVSKITHSVILPEQHHDGRFVANKSFFPPVDLRPKIPITSIYPIREIFTMNLEDKN
jgi:hypothetical protein